MKCVGVIRGFLVVLAALGFCIPQPALAAMTGGDRAPVVTDVELGERGLLLGQVVNPQGMPMAKVTVSLRNTDREIARAKTDNNGYFAVRGLRGGVYQIVAAEGHGAYRLWTPGHAPPTSQKGALVVAGRGAVRGQCGVLDFWLSNPWVVAGIVATAVAVPVAVHNAKRPATR